MFSLVIQIATSKDKTQWRDFCHNETAFKHLHDAYLFQGFPSFGGYFEGNRTIQCIFLFHLFHT